MPKIKNPRVFVKSTKLTDDQANALITSQQLPTAGWVQLNTQGAVELNYERDALDLENAQSGVVAVATKSDRGTLKIPFDSTSFDVLTKYIVVDPNFNENDYYFVMASNRGTTLTGVSLLVYDKDLDPTNETNVPNLTNADQSLRVIFEGVSSEGVMEKWDGEQDIIEVTFRLLANQGSGSARGKHGFGGRATAV